MYEDLHDAKEAIQARDVDELQSSGYYNALIRWMRESKNQLDQESFEQAETLRASMFQYFINNDESVLSEIVESSEELQMKISDAIERLELVQSILWKVQLSPMANEYLKNEVDD